MENNERSRLDTFISMIHCYFVSAHSLDESDLKMQNTMSFEYVVVLGARSGERAGRRNGGETEREVEWEREK